MKTAEFKKLMLIELDRVEKRAKCMWQIKGHVKRISIHVPGACTYTIPYAKESIIDLKKRVKKLSDAAGSIYGGRGKPYRGTGTRSSHALKDAMKKGIVTFTPKRAK